MKRLWLAAACLFAFQAHATLPDSYGALGGREALEAAQKSGKPIMVYFTQRGCGWCRLVEKLLDESAMRGELQRSYHFINVNIGGSKDPASAALQKMFDVQGTPAFAFLDSKAEPLCMVYGSIKDDAELTRIHATVQGLARGGRSDMVARGRASCRGEVTAADSNVTGIAPRK